MASRRVRVLLGTTLGIALVFAGLGFYVRNQTAPVSSRFAPQLVKVREPQSPEDIAKNLQKRNVVRNPSLLARWLKWKGKSTIAAGDYEFSPDQSMWQIADILIHERFTVNWVSFPEGWTMARIAARLSERGIADEAEFLALCQKPIDINGKTINPPSSGFEGYLAADTYRLPPGTGAEAALQTLIANTNRRWNAERAEKAKALGRSMHEILTIASMIEKEAAKDEDRPLIAAVVYNRLKKKMRLQIDAAVLYGMGRWKERVLYADLQHQSLYNTYLNDGLPPGPIASPGIASLDAALNPAKVDYLFYVAKGDGYHQFTSSYSDHLKAIREIRSQK